MVDFLVIGPMCAATYSCLFEFIKDRKMVLGYNSISDFDNNNKSVVCRWFSSMRDDFPQVLLLKEYKEGEYKKYDHFDAINIDRLDDIPDYDGVMGVPISFLDVWNPGQFDVLRVSADWLDDKFNGLKSQYIDGKKIYTRLFIKRKVS